MRHIIRNGGRFPLLKYLILLLILFTLNVSPSKAQETSFWSDQAKIPEINDEVEEPPFIIADSNHTVHAFNSQPLDLENPGSQNAIFYRQWTPESGWTSPIDILVDPDGGNIKLIGVVGDQMGILHLVFQSNNNSVYYSRAYLSEADSYLAWSTPLLIGENSEMLTLGVVLVGSIATDATGNNIVVVYSGSGYGNGLYYTVSSDGGNSWTEPYPIYITGDENIIAYEPKLYWGESNIVHAVWGTRDELGMGGPGYYANYNLTENSWSEPIELVSNGLLTPSIVEKNGNIFFTYLQQQANANFWQRSMDGGLTWTNPNRLAPQHIGTNGAVSFVEDSNGTLHGFFGERINAENHGIWHTTWTGSDWTNPDPVITGPKIRDGVGGNGFDPSSAHAVIVNGNEALVLWVTDGTSGFNGAWYTHKKLDAPEIPAMTLPAPPAVQLISKGSTPVPTETPRIQETPTNLPGNLFNSPRSTQNPQSILLISIIPVLAVLLGMMFLRYIHSSKK